MREPECQWRVLARQSPQARFAVVVADLWFTIQTPSPSKMAMMMAPPIHGAVLVP
jgi:hypothetical protein